MAEMLREDDRGKTMSVRQEKPRDIKKRTFAFALAIVWLYQELEARPGVARTLCQQLLRAGTSVGANVEEAQAGQSRADFVSKYSIALKEARETIYWLRLLREVEPRSEGRIDALRAEADEIARIIGSIIVRAKEKGRK